MKYIGLFFVFAAPLFCGFRVASHYKSELLQLEGFLAMLQHIKYEVSSFLTKQSDIFSGFKNAALEKCGFLPALRAYEFDCEDSMLTGALLHSGHLLAADAETRRILLLFAESLGKVSAAEQAVMCDNYSQLLRDGYEGKKKEITARVKLSRTLGFAMGFGLLLLLL